MSVTHGRFDINVSESHLLREVIELLTFYDVFTCTSLHCQLQNSKIVCLNK